MPATYIYWIGTTLLSAIYLSSAALYLFKPAFVRQAQADLGYHAAHLVPFLVAVKILGSIAVVTRISVPLSDLAYAGFFYHLLLSGLAHLGADKPKGAIPAAIGLVLLAVSFMTQNAARNGVSPCAPSPSAHHFTAKG